MTVAACETRPTVLRLPRSTERRWETTADQRAAGEKSYNY